MADPHRETDQARRWKQRRAYSLFELLAVLAIIGAVAGMAVTKFGHATYEAADAQGFARRMALDVSQTRRRAIASGDDHYLQFSRVSGAVVGYTLYRDASGGAYAADDFVPVPTGATVTTATDVWTFDFSGALTTAGTSSTIRIDGAEFYWTVTIYHATGYARVTKTAL